MAWRTSVQKMLISEKPDRASTNTSKVVGAARCSDISIISPSDSPLLVQEPAMTRRQGASVELNSRVQAMPGVVVIASIEGII